ncbi:translocation/assembly module TamB domain-containing protein [uncultured Pseudomonas sp.]|uniref:translocation/assembly module TamB domain-containing protein n=1 Tax=uncultured Pseudomonas sp. TaxID=114707 RepID=UPI0025E24895|nr:translocation/assembly module TamB domain-containing protein [uncultured Pseudomonas sp.]
MKSLGGVVLGILAALLGALILLLVLVLSNASIGRALLGQVPGLTLTGFQGRLGSQWQAQQLVWQGGATRVTVDEPQFAWRPGCLLRLQLCIDTLVASRVAIDQAPSSEPAPAQSGPVRLPSLGLPLAVRLGEVRLGQVLYNGAEQARDLQLQARWQADGVAIERLAGAAYGLTLDTQGHLQPKGDWPLQLSGTLGLPAPDQAPWSLALKVEGELQETLRLTADSSGYLPGQLTGTVQPLVEHVPADLQLVANGFKAASLPDTLRLNDLKLTARGDLAAGYALVGQATLPGEGGPVALNLDGAVDAKGARIAALRLQATPEQRVVLAGQLDWQQGLAADATLDWRDFPWRRLYPMAEPPVTLQRLQGEVAYRDGGYLGNLKAEATGPAGAFTLVTPFSGDTTQLNLPSLDLQAGQGRAQGKVNLGFAEGVTWQVALDLSRLDPAFWVAQLPGSLAGPLRSSGTFKDGRLQLDADLDLKGRLRNQPAVLAAQAKGAGEQWQVSQLDIRLGDNRIQGQGALDQRLQGQLQLDLRRLAQLWPDLAGSAQGRLDLGGTLKAPAGQLRLNGRQLAYADNRIAGLALTADLDERQRGKLELSAQGLQAAGRDFGVLRLQGQGDRRQQQADLTLDGPPVKLALNAGGTLADNGDWKGQLARGSVAASGQNWTLASPARIERLANGRLELGRHCWRSGAASLCGDDQQLLPDTRLAWHLRAFPLASLQPLLPPELAWQGSLDGDVDLRLPKAGPDGEVRLQAGRGSLKLRDAAGQWQTFSYDSLDVTSALKPQQVDTQVRLTSADLGRLDVQARLDPRDPNQALAGRFQLQGLNLALGKAFVEGIEHLEGKINGAGELGGTLLQPRVNGQLQLTGGDIGGGSVPTRLQDLGLTARIQGDTAVLDGGWRSGTQGRGQIQGSVGWAQGLDVNVAVTGDRLPVNVEPYAQLEVAPNLKILMKDGRLALAGEVRVPRGHIQVRQLPPSTVKVSDDAVIVGQEAPARQQPLQIAMDVDVLVGADKLSFDAFGLSAEIVGKVHIGDNLDTRGELNLRNGRYNAYGQRLTMRRARLFFQGPIAQPYIDVEAVRVVQEQNVTAGLRLSGFVQQPRIEVFSEPSMSQEQALAYLVLGRPLSSGSEGDNNVLGQAALALGLAGSSGTAGELAQRLGIQNFQLDTAGSGDKTSVVASGNLTDRLSLRYGVGVFDSANTVALRYQLTRRLYLEIASGLANSLDFFYRRDF